MTDNDILKGQMALNRNYKSSVFSFLFGEPDAARELYEALEGVTLPADVEISMKTLEGVLYRTMLNDLAFLVGSRLIVLIEHQASINPNMAIRLLIYVARVYEKLTAGKNLYGRKLLSLPRPELIVLYNGPEPYPDEFVLSPADSYEDVQGLFTGSPPALELKVKVYNINHGHNEGMVKRSEKLHGYSILVAKTREYLAEIAGGRESKDVSGEEKDEALKRAIQWCIAQDILKPFLETHGTEVANMLFDEWKLEDALVVEREEGREEGLQEGREEVVRNLLAEKLPIELIQRATGLDRDSIQRLAAGP
jgi:hypothetical protein